MIARFILKDIKIVRITTDKLKIYLLYFLFIHGMQKILNKQKDLLIKKILYFQDTLFFFKSSIK